MLLARPFAAVLVMLTVLSSASAAELVMYRRAGCPWCLAWEREIGPIYGKTDMGRRVPLRVIDLDQPDRREIFLSSPIRYTPTFVLVAENREIARLEGYPGEDFFWGNLDRIFKRLPSNPRDDLPVARPDSPGSGE
jgi:hypothetical protein